MICVVVLDVCVYDFDVDESLVNVLSVKYILIYKIL